MARGEDCVGSLEITQHVNRQLYMATPTLRSIHHHARQAMGSSGGLAALERRAAETTEATVSERQRGGTALAARLCSCAVSLWASFAGFSKQALLARLLGRNESGSL